MKMKIFGLLHLAENEQSAMNISTKNFREQVSVYINNATVLSKSLHLKGVEFALLTNNKLLVEKCAHETSDGFSLDIIEIPFITKVPSGIRFFSAHYKIDAFRYLASNSHFVPKRAIFNGIEGFIGSIGGCVTHSCSAFSARRSQATCFWGPLGSSRAH